jgi:tRNA(fMet)-specific endonuclease VapC
MIIFDTDILTIWQRESGGDYDRVAARVRACAETIHITIVSVEEQMRGWLAVAASARTPEEYATAAARLHEMLRDYQTRSILDFSNRAAEWMHQIKKSKVKVSTMDLRIAAIVLANNATLITRNLRHFAKVPGLKAEDWTVAR